MLSLRIDFKPDMSATSLASLLARRNFCRDLRSFCADLGLSYIGLGQGAGEQIAMLAELAAVPLPDLMRNTFIAQGERAYVVGGQRITATLIKRARTRVCPCCIAEDVACATADPMLSVYSRLPWEVTFYRCHRHGVRLVDLPLASREHRYDFTKSIEPQIDGILAVARRETPTAPEPVDRYFANRLTNIAQVPHFLDGLGFSAGYRFCQALGVLSTLGSKGPLRRSLTVDQLAAALSAGFAIVSDGLEGVRSFLRYMQSKTDPNFKSGANHAFGAAALLLRTYNKGPGDPELHKVRQILRQHLMDTTAVGPGDLVLGEPMTEPRRIHSITTLGAQFKLHPHTVRKIMIARGLVSPTLNDVAHVNVMMPAALAEATIRRPSESLQRKEVIDYLNISPGDYRFISPAFLVPEIEIEGMLPVYHPEVLDNFLKRLSARSVPVASVAPNMLTLRDAANHSRVGIVLILQAVLDGHMGWVGQRVGVQGIRGLLLDSDEVRRTFPPHSGVGLPELAREFGVPVESLVAASKAGLITVEKAHAGGGRYISVQLEAKLLSELVSLRDLARDRRTKTAPLRRKLDIQGIRPHPDWLSCGAVVYDRRDARLTNY